MARTQLRANPSMLPTLKYLSAGEVMAFRDTHYKTGNLIVQASGVSHDTLKSLAATAYAWEGKLHHHCGYVQWRT